MKIISLNILVLILFCTNSFSQKKNNSQYSASIKAFDAYCKQGLIDWKMPGMAVAIIKDGNVIFEKGYGVRKLNSTDAFDPQTIFGIASTTKAMTAACIAILVDEGKIKWTDPVIKYLPDFQLYDSYVTRELQVRDLLLHNSGVGNTDYLWGNMDIPSDEILHRMRLVEPTYSFRSGFIYQNIFYLVAGQLIEKVSGMPWDKFVEQRIFIPLGMNRTFSLYAKVNDSNQATPHFNLNDTIIEIESWRADAIAPAGSVFSCVDDMSKWILCMCDSSKFNGGRLLSPDSWKQLLKPQEIIKDEDEYYPTQTLTHPNFTSYGYGWFQQDYMGRKINFHTGSLDGDIAIACVIPEEHFGFYILGNLDHAELRHALMFKAIDLFVTSGNRDWSKEFLKLYQSIKDSTKKYQNEADAKRVMNTKPTLPLENYAGTYSSPLYGEVVIDEKDGQLKMNINHILPVTLTHWNYDTFKCHYSKPHWLPSMILFSLNKEGKIASMEIDGQKFVKQ